MELREHIEIAVHAEQIAKADYDKKSREVRDMTYEFFSLKYDVSTGGTVYTEAGRELRLQSYRMWSGNLDDRPDIKASVRLPFGWSKTTKRYSSKDWMTKGEMDERRGNG